MEKEVKKFISCEYCGNDKPWARKEWFIPKGVPYCSAYCRQSDDMLHFNRNTKKMK